MKDIFLKNKNQSIVRNKRNSTQWKFVEVIAFRLTSGTFQLVISVDKNIPILSLCIQCLLFHFFLHLLSTEFILSFVSLLLYSRLCSPVIEKKGSFLYAFDVNDTTKTSISVKQYKMWYWQYNIYCQYQTYVHTLYSISCSKSIYTLYISFCASFLFVHFLLFCFSSK